MTVERNLELNLGLACNNRCIFCLDLTALPEARKWLPIERALDELHLARGEGATSVGLLGGEPTAHPRILDIVREARDAGYGRIALQTNGLRLSDPDLCRSLVESGVNRISMSVHSFSAADEDYLTGRAGNFAKKRRAVENLVALRKEGFLEHNVSLNAVLTTRIHSRLVDYAGHYRQLGITDVRFNMIRTDSCLDRGPELTPRLQDLAPEIARAVAASESRLHMDLSFGDLPLCAYPWEILENRPLAGRVIGEARDLDTWVAVFSAPRDLTRAPDRFKWTERKKSALKIQPEDPCSRCGLAELCEGVWRSYVALHGGSELRPL